MVRFCGQCKMAMDCSLFKSIGNYWFSVMFDIAQVYINIYLEKVFFACSLDKHLPLRLREFTCKLLLCIHRKLWTSGQYGAWTHDLGVISTTLCPAELTGPLLQVFLIRKTHKIVRLTISLLLSSNFIIILNIIQNLLCYIGHHLDPYTIEFLGSRESWTGFTTNVDFSLVTSSLNWNQFTSIVQKKCSFGLPCPFQRHH